MCNREISSRRIDWFFSAKLYDHHQGPIARGGGSYQPPLTVRVMRNALTGRGLIIFFIAGMRSRATFGTAPAPARKKLSRFRLRIRLRAKCSSGFGSGSGDAKFFNYCFTSPFRKCLPAVFALCRVRSQATSAVEHSPTYNRSGEHKHFLITVLHRHSGNVYRQYSLCVVFVAKQHLLSNTVRRITALVSIGIF